MVSNSMLIVLTAALFVDSLVVIGQTFIMKVLRSSYNLDHVGEVVSDFGECRETFAIFLSIELPEWNEAKYLGRLFLM